MASMVREADNLRNLRTACLHGRSGGPGRPVRPGTPAVDEVRGALPDLRIVNEAGPVIGAAEPSDRTVT
ncbi:hypothetical protein GCM10010363_40940 [Streptomyces omiyaensis]|nr:hypothetical protein GCM10010363_40940 [Streptomyces omiyaensis]